MVELKFERLSLNQREEYETYYQASPEKSSDTSFINLWAWDNKYQTETAFAEGLCWLRFKQSNGYIYGPPLGDYAKVEWKHVFAKYLPTEANFKSMPELLTQKLQQTFAEQLSVCADRDNWEYVYKIADLVSLSGEKYRNQRKLSNQFLQNNDYKLVPIDEENIEQVKIFQQEWLKKSLSEASGLEQETLAIDRVLDSWQRLNDKIFGYILMAESKAVGYTIGEKQDKEHIIIHFEKALTEVRGAYPSINKLTLEKLSHYQYVNREQDLGLAGLRRAKEEYNPIGFIKKYQLVLRQN